VRSLAHLPWCIGGWQQVWYHVTLTYVTVFGQPAVCASLKNCSLVHFLPYTEPETHDTLAANFSSFEVATYHMQNV
jgi:hypothetical protein